VGLKHTELVDLLKKAYSAEKAAAFAYQGHAGAVKNTEEKKAAFFCSVGLTTNIFLASSSTSITTYSDGRTTRTTQTAYNSYKKSRPIANLKLRCRL